MEEFIPKFIDISDWNKIPYSSTGGTRAKKIYLFPEEDKEYFFKGSKKLDNGQFKYITEFWSEIVASKVGLWLGFDMLNYNIGYDINDEQQIGCLSKSMVHHTDNKLSEGVDYLRGYDPKYNPKEDEERYTLKFIRETLNYFELSQYERAFIEMMIFDAIIGNSDRHQENWGFISKFRETLIEIEKEIATSRGFFRRIEPKLRKWVAKIMMQHRKMESEKNSPPRKTILKTQSQLVETIFSPIYDSGCSLGRELLSEKIDKMLKDDIMMEAFLRRGPSEIRWIDGGKPKHFEILKNLKQEFPDYFASVKNNVSLKFDNRDLDFLVTNIDRELPKELLKHKLPDNRKALMTKLITLRIKKLEEL